MIPLGQFMPAGNTAGNTTGDTGAQVVKRAEITTTGSPLSDAASESPFFGWIQELIEKENFPEAQCEGCLDGQPHEAMAQPGWGQFLALIAHANNQGDGESGLSPQDAPADASQLENALHLMATLGSKEAAKQRPGASNSIRSLSVLLEEMGFTNTFFAKGSSHAQAAASGTGGGIPEFSETTTPVVEGDTALGTRAMRSLPESAKTIAEGNTAIAGKEIALAEPAQGTASIRDRVRRRMVAEDSVASNEKNDQGAKDNAARFHKAEGVNPHKTEKANDFKSIDAPKPQPDQMAASIKSDDGHQRLSEKNITARIDRNSGGHDPAFTEEMVFTEKQEAKGVAFDPTRNAGTDSNRFQDGFQFGSKSAFVGKMTPSESLPANRPEALAAKSFQTAVMDQIVEKISVRTFPGRSEMQIRLKPDFLGNVQMHITTEKEQLVVRMITDQTAVKEIVESNLHQLKSELQNQGLTIDRFDIMVNPDAEQQSNRDQFAQLFKQPTAQNGDRRGQNQKSDTDAQEPESRTNDDQPEEEGINYFA